MSLRSTNAVRNFALVQEALLVTYANTAAKKVIKTTVLEGAAEQEIAMN